MARSIPSTSTQRRRCSGSFATRWVSPARSSAAALHVDGQPVRSCSFPVSLAVGKTIKTIEGVSSDGNHAIQRAWKELDAPQCGYCESGMIMSALALLERKPNPTDADIDAAVTNACRCSSYHRVRKAIHLAAGLMKADA